MFRRSAVLSVVCCGLEISVLLLLNACSLEAEDASRTAADALVDIDSNLVGHWTFDTAKVSAATVLDSSSAGNNGMLGGSPLPAIVSGKVAQALSLSNASQLVSVPDSTTLNITGPFTTAAWVNFSTLPGSAHYPNVVAKLTSPLGYYGYGMIWNGTGVAGIIGPGSPKWFITLPYRPMAGVWNHFATVFDGATLKLYVNGALHSQTTATAPAGTAAIPMKIGPHYTSPSAYGAINGLVDEVRIYKRALTALDVAQLCGATQPPSTADTLAPTIAVTAPSSGSTVSNTVTVTASASDNVGVARVEFYRDNTLVGTDTAAPYSIADDTTKLTNGSHTYSAKAFDAAGNVATSPIATVTVSNATPMTTAGRAQWVQRMVAGFKVYTAGVATDNANNVAVAGAFITGVDFGNGMIPSRGALDGFVARYSPQGALLWAKTFGESGDDRSHAVAVDSAGNVFVTGFFQKTVNFGGFTLTANDPYRVGQPDIFVLKYSSAGALLWAKQFGGASYDVGKGLAVDSSGNVLFVATFTGTVDFGGVTLRSNEGSADVAVAKLSGSTGATIWAKGWGGAGYDTPSGIAVDAAGNAVVIGNTNGAVDLGGGLTGNGGTSIAKYSGVDGSYQWGKVLAVGAGNGIAAEASTGNVFVTGSFFGSADFGGGTMTTPRNGNGGVYVAAFGSAGDYRWAKVYGAADDAGLAVSVDTSGNLAVTGHAAGLIDFAGGTGIYTSGRGYLLLNLTTTGAYRWSKRASSSASYGYGLTFDSGGRLLATGSFQGTVDFGGISIVGPSGGTDGFVAAYTN